VRIAELRKAKARTMYGWEALALAEERIRRENLHRLELLRLKAYVPLWHAVPAAPGGPARGCRAICG
jgi:hypothetical protein